jgi:hypothetical protein
MLANYGFNLSIELLEKNSLPVIAKADEQSNLPPEQVRPADMRFKRTQLPKRMLRRSPESRMNYLATVTYVATAGTPEKRKTNVGSK